MEYNFARISPVDEEELAKILQQVDRFKEIWNSRPTLVEQIGYFKGDGSPGDVSKLDYVIYEQLGKLFVEDGDEFVMLGVGILGQTLVKQLQFEWCSIPIGNNPVIGLRSRENGMKVPIQAKIIHRLSCGYPQSEPFEYLFFDIYESTLNWPRGSHPLIDAVQMDEEDEDEEYNFEKFYGHKIPKDIIKEMTYLYYQGCYNYQERLFYDLGLSIYEDIAEKNWESLRFYVKEQSKVYKKIYGEFWKEKIKKEYPEEFEDYD